MARYDFRKVTADDFALLAQWQAEPHVAQWWGDEPFDATDLEDRRMALWMVSDGRRPFAFMQDYDVHGWADHHFGHLPAGARGIDQFIGEVGMIGHGHGLAFIAERVEAMFDGGAPVIATDPHPDNARAIAAYRMAGFEVAGPPGETQWGLVLPMLRWRDAS